MSDPTTAPKTPTPGQKKLSPELSELRKEVKTDMSAMQSDMHKDMKDLITPLQDSINMLLKINKKWERSLKECSELKPQNLQLNTKMSKIENDNKLLRE